MLDASTLLSRYYQETYELFSTVLDRNTASSINWSSYLEDRLQPVLKANEEVKKLHVNDAIKDLEKQSELPLVNAYNLLSEFVHPNAGSKMLIINTKQSRYPLMDALTIGENKGNAEAALFYVDHLAESMFYTWTLALTLFRRGQDLIAAIDSLVPTGASRNVH